MLWGRKTRRLAGTALLWALAPGLQAQVAWGDLHATANGQLTTLYTDSFGNLAGTDEHSLGFAGRGMITGDYYNPNFFSFSMLPYYGRSQDNSDMQSITDASGYNGTLNIFKGSRFPGFVNFEQTWNKSGTFGIPGLAGLTTTNNNHGVNVGWSALLPGLPTLSVGYGDTGGSSALLGSSSATASTTRNFNIGTTYSRGGYYLTGGFIHLNSDVNINGLGIGEPETGTGGAGTETTTGSSNQYRLTGQGPIPYRSSSASLSITRSSFSYDDSFAGKDYGTTDTVNGIVNLAFPRAPVTLTALYTDNLLGSVEQQLVSSGQVPILPGLNSPESRSLMVGASTFVNVLPRLLVGGYVNRTQQYFGGQNFGVTQIGLNASYNFVHKLKGLSFYAGVIDNASQDGNTHAGLIGNVTYNRYFGKWEINGYLFYDQDTMTLLANYTTSTVNYGGTLKREINPDLRWVTVANVIHSVFEQTSGDSSHGESFTTMLIWKRASVSGIYSQSSGVAILTATGLVATPVPPQLFGPGSSVLFSGRNYGGTVTFYPIRHLDISTSWTRSIGDTTSPLLLSNNGNTNYYGFATYEYRKLLFQAGYTRFDQSISMSGQPPSMLTSYTFGISRWFKGF